MNYYGSPQAPRTAILSDSGSAGVSEGVSGCLNAGHCSLLWDVEIARHPVRYRGFTNSKD